MPKPFMKVSVIGTGYVGLVSGVCLASKGHQVVCVDIDANKVEKINNRQSPIHEKGLPDLLCQQIGANFSASTSLETAVLDSDITLIAVGTPFDGQKIDLRAIELASQQIGEALKKKQQYHVIVIKSTVVPGTTEDRVLPLLEKFSGKKAGKDFGVGMNPEFLREGNAIDDFMFPDRIVIGGIDQNSLATMRNLYSVFEHVEVVETNCRTAEMIKYTSNSFLATLISFTNEIANLCSVSGKVDINDVMYAVCLDKRISPQLQSGERISPPLTTYLKAGCGFGGSCFPKDVKALIEYGHSHGNTMKILQSVIDVNQQQPHKIIQLIKKHFNNLSDIKVAVLGYAFKPGTDDIRESPAIPITQLLLEEGASVSGFDPVAQDNAKELFPHRINFYATLKEAIDSVDVVVIVTQWEIFSELPSLIKNMNFSPLVVDGRRMLNKNEVEQYKGIGLGQ